jgi:hypothetical protein
VIAIDKPLIGRELSTVLPAALSARLGDPSVLGGPIAFVIPRGQRLTATGLDVKLGGQIPAGLSTGDIQIEFLTDAGGRIYRNPFQPDEQRPENLASPLYVDLSMDVAIYTVDPVGNAVISQIALGCKPRVRGNRRCARDRDRGVAGDGATRRHLGTDEPRARADHRHQGDGHDRLCATDARRDVSG